MSWHYTVDDHAIVQHLPDYETATTPGRQGRAGQHHQHRHRDLRQRRGRFCPAQANAASLVRLLMESTASR